MTRDDGRHSLAAALIDNSFRLLANKLLKLTAAPQFFLNCLAAPVEPDHGRVPAQNLMVC